MTIKATKPVSDDEFFNYVVTHHPTYATEPTKNSMAFWRSADKQLVGYINYNKTKEYFIVTYEEDANG